MYSKTLGLDIGTNSVGSAWIDLKQHKMRMGASVFPAGIEESDTKRGAPKNQARRGARCQRRSIERRAKRKHQMRSFLVQKGWIDTDERKWLGMNPWILRRDGLKRELSPYEFGRVLLHLTQRRGAFGFDSDSDEDKEQGKIKEAISHTRQEIAKYNAETFGELMAMQFQERKIPIEKVDKQGKRVEISSPIRNRTKGSGEGTYEFCADRDLIWDEFDKLWNKQKSFGGELAAQLTDECRKELDNPKGDAAWRYKGILLGQRKTYWDMGTMARCDLEPTDMRCPKGDMYAQEFLVLETVNNIRITARGESNRPLTREEREKVINALEKQKTASEATVRKALGIDKGEKKTQYTLSLEKDPERGLNTNWFRREIVLGAIGPEKWAKMGDRDRESINRAILTFDPQDKNDAEQLTTGCRKWWGFDEGQTTQFIEAWKNWKKRPKVDDRVNYSRKAIRNLLPYMRDGSTVNKARELFAEDAENGATAEQRTRYCFGAKTASRRTRQYGEKHPDLLPPAPDDLSNPVVRKAIHEVRRHIQAYIREFGCKPDRVVVELAREARQSAKVRNKQLADNRQREKERKKIIQEFNLEGSTKNQQEKAIKRVLLCREQRQRCAYCEEEKDTISEKAAAEGTEVELDHIIPESRGGDSGMNNLVLCHTRCNRGKGNKTPREWLTQEQFGRLEKRLQHLKKTTKWDNLHTDAPDIDGFVESQLTDTAYASRQVVGWLRDVLYEGERDGVRRVFTTKGRYTSILRRDWGLFPDKKEANSEGEQGKKNRADHRHHALDAVVIALSGPERLSQLAQAAEKQELAKSEGYEYPKRDPVRPPWGDFDSFRADVMKEWNNIVVAHRPERRKITGAFHRDTHFGPLLDKKGQLTGHCTVRKFAVELTPKHLRVPNGWEELRKKLEISASKTEQKHLREQMLSLEDKKPEMSGIVRDRWFREELRACLRRNNLDPDNFTAKEIKELVKNKGIVLRSGVPVRRFTLMRAPTVVEIPRKRWNADTRKMEYETNRQSVRLYEPQNNHHIEIRQNKRTQWFGEVITNYDAAKRLRPPKNSGQDSRTAVNRNDTEEGRFVMSLSIGEMVYMRHPETREPCYFVIFKIDGTGSIHFTPHWDAGRAKETEKFPARDDIALAAKRLQELGVEPGLPPQKVWVGPLGDVKTLVRD